MSFVGTVVSRLMLGRSIAITRSGWLSFDDHLSQHVHVFFGSDDVTTEQRSPMQLEPYSRILFSIRTTGRLQIKATGVETESLQQC